MAIFYVGSKFQGERMKPFAFFKLWARESRQENQTTFGKDLNQKELEQKNLDKEEERVSL